MSAAQRKRLEALEHGLRDRYASDWAALREMEDTCRHRVFGGMSDAQLEALREWNERNPSIQDLWLDSLGLQTYRGNEGVPAVQTWMAQMWALLEGLDTPPYPIPPIPKFETLPYLEDAALLESRAEDSPAPDMAHLYARMLRASLELFESARQRWPHEPA